jgi:hypothetical protein
MPWSKGWISAVVFFGKIITTIIPSFDFRDSEEGCAWTASSRSRALSSSFRENR